jgi:glycosyltransferase involved in cell wall biosynthesis
MHKLVIVTVGLPRGPAEAFLLPEIQQLAQAVEVRVVPMRPRGPVFHPDAKPLEELGWIAPLLGVRVIGGALAEAVRGPTRVWRVLWRIVRGSRSPSVLLKNLVVTPKGLWLARRARAWGAEHIHSYWAAGCATVAMIAAEVSGIPWSLTAHRWDISENNLLAEKAASARFVRTISAAGARELRSLAGAAAQPRVLYLGADLPGSAAPHPVPSRTLQLLTAATFTDVKGHRYLVEALARLARESVAFEWSLAGLGPLRSEIARQIQRGGIADRATFLGMVPHPELLARFDRRDWDLVVLPSIVTARGEKEGIPVSLIEAMARGIPVVGTATGSIPELVTDGAGILVPEKDPEALADAIRWMANDADARRRLGEAGRKRVLGGFSAECTVRELLDAMRRSPGSPAAAAAV